jgi:hypothetical protein
MSKRLDTDWGKELKKSETIFNEELGKRVVLLRGLQRLAHEAGLQKSDLELYHCVGPTGKGMIQCKYTVHFEDGSSWVGAADCSAANTVAEFVKYPTAIAESRAESRALKKALRIEMHSAEEMGMNPLEGDLQLDGKLSPEQLLAIQGLMKVLKINGADVVEAAVEGDRQNDIHALEELTFDEGVSAIEFLNKKRGEGVKTARKAKKKVAKNG